jgi:hypothetical protein
MFLQRIVTAFILFGSDSGGGPGPSDDAMGLREGLDQGVSLPPVPPLSPSIPHGWTPQPSTPPPQSVGPTRSQSLISDEANWFRATLQTIAGAEVEDVRDSGLRGDRGGSWDMGGDPAVGGGDGDAQDRGESQCAGLPELQPLVVSPSVL